jgi:flagella basal body P-ring formation protein FlgA
MLMDYLVVLRTRTLTLLQVAAAAAGMLTAAAHAAGPDGWPDGLVKQVESAARDALDEQADRAGWAEPQFDVAVVRGSRPLPACAGPLAVDVVDARHPSRMRFALICSGSDGWRQEVVVRATVSARVLIAANDLPAGRPLGTNDVALDRRDITAVADALSDPHAVDGMASRRPLRSGDVLRKSTLAGALLVKRGDAVRIVARSGGIEVTVAGEALEDGARDATVKVRNTGNGNVIRARVTGAGTVEPAELGVSTPPH